MARLKKRAMWRSIGTSTSHNVETTITAELAKHADLLSSVVASFSSRALRALRSSSCGVVCIGLALTGCSKPADAPTKQSPTYKLRQVELPDLSHAVPSVQQQLRDGYTALKKRIDAPSASPDELALAYGQMGMLLMAAEYRGEAE